MIGLATVRQRGLTLRDVANGLAPDLLFRLHQTISRIARRYGDAAALSWTQSVLRHQARIPLQQLQSALASGNLHAIASAIDPVALQQTLDRAARDTLRRATVQGGQLSASALRAAGIGASFNAVHPNVILYAQTRAAALVRNVPDDVRASIRSVVALGAAGQLTVEQQARLIKTAVGLPPHWLSAPLRLGDEMRMGSLAALDRRLSAADKAVIRSAIRRGTVTPALIQEMQGRYSAALIAARAETIARTETLAAINVGVHESWQQAITDGNLPATARRMWILTPDERLCEICASIPDLNPDGVGMDEPFDTPEGPVMDPPAPHPNCRCAVGLIFPDTTTPESVVTEPDLGGFGVPFLPETGVEVAAPELSDVEILAQPSSAYPLANPEGADTFERYVVNRGGRLEFTPERQALHEVIVNAHFSPDLTPVTVGRPKVTVLGGGPASGKSTVLTPAPNHVVIDVDAIRAKLPEYGEQVALHNRNVAPFTHEESSAISKQVLDRAMAEGYNVWMDTTGDGEYEKLARKLVQYRAAGYEVVGEYITVDTDTALQFALGRAGRTGRYVDETYLRETHRTISAVVPRSLADGLYDSFTLYDNNGEVGASFPVARYRDGQLQILDERAWQRFASKAMDDEQMVQLVRQAGALGSSLAPRELAEYLGAYGQRWTAQALPPGIPRGVPKQCYANATQLLLEHPDWSYVEGVAYTSETGDIPFMHAWLVDAEGRVIDPTWGNPAGARYFGVKYDRTAYLTYLRGAEHYGVLGAGGRVAERFLATGASGLRAVGVVVPTEAAVTTEAQRLYERTFGFRPRNVPAWRSLRPTGEFAELRTKYLAQAEINLRAGTRGRLPPNPRARPRRARAPVVSPEALPDPFAGHVSGTRAERRLNETHAACPPVVALTAQTDGTFRYLVLGAVQVCRVPALTEEERNAIREYQDGRYRRMNGVLRQGRAAVIKEDGKRLVQEAEQLIQALDAALRKMPALDEAMVVWRGVEPSAVNRTFLARLTEGTEFVDQGFVSTSVDRRIGERYMVNVPGTDEEAFILRIGVPRGVQGAWLPQQMGDRAESEFLLRRGSRFRVMRIRKLTGAEYRAEFGPGSKAVRDRTRVTVVDVEVIS